MTEGYGLSRAELVHRGVTMNSLKSQQHALSMRLLLAMQNHDQEAQRELERQMKEVREQMACIGAIHAD